MSTYASGARRQESAARHEDIRVGHRSRSAVRRPPAESAAAGAEGAERKRAAPAEADRTNRRHVRR
jgi:hypothetical protein